MRKFDTKVQELKYKVLRTVAEEAIAGRLTETLLDIPKMIIPGKTPTMRCCIYKERAILSERVRIAMGGDKKNPNVIQVIDIACDECPAAGYEVTSSCRGCLAHRCEAACRKGAIFFDNHSHVAHIDKSKCVECGMCSKVCPYSAIVVRTRPCQNACKPKAISIDPDNHALIDNSKCVSCGSCVYQCPFGAIMDKSFILNVIDMLKKSENGGPHVYAVVAPSISSQFSYAKLGQVVAGMKQMGFHTVVEAALGADMVALGESKELVEKGFLLSSCCPAFVDYTKKNFPEMAKHISGSLSPMGAIAKYIKSNDPSSKVVFIGPCTAKKVEVRKETVAPYVDEAMTFEELQALIDAYGIDLTSMENSPLDNASYYGRIFARCGGLSDAVAEALKEQNIEFALNGTACDGIEACKTALFKKSKNVPGADWNFIEGMACEGGCIGGPGCLTHGPKDRMQVDAYGREAMEKTIKDAVSLLK